MTELERAAELWSRTASKAAQRKAARFVKDDIATWQIDPQVKNVVGLVLKGDSSNRAIVILYLNDQDFEVDEDYF